MSLLRMFGLGGKKKRSVEEPLDGLAVAREEMLNRMRSRMEADPVDPDGAFPEAYPETPEHGPSQPLGDVPQPSGADPLAGIQADVMAADAAASPDSALGAGTGGALPDLGSDLLDVFRDAREETEEGSLASELEEVSINDLLGDIRGVSSRLGVKPERKVEAAPEPAAETPDADLLAEEEEAPYSEPEPPLQPPANLRQVQFEEEDPEPDAAEPELSVDAHYQDEYVDPPYGEPGGAGGQRYFMHVLFLGLALALGIGLGIRGAQGGTLAADADATPGVLAYLNPPIVMPRPAPVETNGEEIKALQKDARAATPSPTPAPSPTPTPKTRRYPFIPGQPAWLIYAIQSGDSLTSISEAFEMCPDHILWNNPDRQEEDRLIVGDEMLLPGYPGIVYRLQEGETLVQVAARFSTTVDMVLSYPGNGLVSLDEATEGTVVLLPDAIPPSALLQDADAQWAYTNPSDDGYVWPFYGPITTYYGEERPGYIHYGIDVGGLGHFGAPVLAAAEGRVDKVDNVYDGLGRYIIISHPDGSRSVYGHMSDVYVKTGDYVARGEPVGALGCSGRSTGTHLHFELWIDGVPVDPLAYLP